MAGNAIKGAAIEALVTRVFGAKLTPPPLGWLFNPFFRRVSKKWLLNSSPIDTQPWRLLSTRLAHIRVEQRMGGVMYLVSGRI